MKRGKEEHRKAAFSRYFSVGWCTRSRKARPFLLILPVLWLMLVGRFNFNDLFLLDNGSSPSLLLMNSVPGSNGGGCPAVIQQARGIYNQDEQQYENKTNNSAFDRIVLLTAANYGYYDLLQNWEYLARAQGLKWAVLALDDRLYRELGSSRAVPNSSPEYAVEGVVKWSTSGFNTLSCNKMRSVLQIMEDCDVDVVFSDCDNIFIGDPFQHDLGRMIKMGQYDYIYQVNEQIGHAKQDRQHSCLKEGKLVREGNTGFYYISRHSETMKQVIRTTLDKCSEPKNKLDDQTLFWNVLFGRAKKGMTRHCNATEVDAAANDPVSLAANRIQPATDTTTTTTVSLCCLDPFHFPIGRNTFQNMITYHSNYVKGKKQKVHLLKHARSDHIGFNIHRVEACRFPWILVRMKCWLLWWA